MPEIRIRKKEAKISQASVTAIVSVCEDGPKANVLPCRPLSTVPRVTISICSFMILNVWSSDIMELPKHMFSNMCMVSLMEDVSMSTRPSSSTSLKPMTPAVSVVASAECRVMLICAESLITVATAPNEETLCTHPHAAATTAAVMCEQPSCVNRPVAVAEVLWRRSGRMIVHRAAGRQQAYCWEEARGASGMGPHACAPT